MPGHRHIRLGRVPYCGPLRSWALWNVIYSHVGRRARAGDVAGLLRLLAQAKDREDRVWERAMIAAALGRLNADAAIGPLAALLDPGVRVEIRVCAADALRRIGGPHAARALVPALADERYGVKKPAIQATVSLGDDEINARIARLAAGDPERFVRSEAVEALGDTKNDKWVPLLLDIAQHDEIIVAVSSAGALMGMNTPTSKAALRRLGRTRFRLVVGVYFVLRNRRLHG